MLPAPALLPSARLTGMSTPIVVVGAGLGGLRLVEELRRAGHEGPLVLVGEELEHPYDRPPLSKEVLRGEVTEPTHLRAVEEYAELDVDLRLGVTATGLDAGARTLALSDGSTLAYDRLVLAPGATPRLLPGTASRPGLHVLRTHDDALRLREAVLAEKALAIVGGGFIGCEVAASARALGAEVDLVELLPGPLVRALGPVVAGRIAQLHRDHGVRLHVGTGVTAFRGEASVEGLELSDGTVLDSRVVLVGLGVVPATSWLAGSGVELGQDGAVLCDRFGRTSAAGVWAVGDAAAWTDATGRQRRVEHWMTAVEQAATVAANLRAASEDDLAPHVGVPYFWSDQYASSLQALGEVAPDTEAEVHDLEGGGLVALHTGGDRLLGAVVVDSPRHVGKARRLLRAGSDVAGARAALLG